MAEVRIPTILRNFTGGERAVEAAGATVTDVIADLEANHTGIKERLLENEEVRRFVNIYVNDEDIRFTGGLATSVPDTATVVILPAVAGGSAVHVGTAG
jgi:molybdopterin converting factor small subunit